MAIALTATANTTGGYVALELSDAGTGAYTVTRTAADGATAAVRNGEPAVASAGGWLGNDYEAPLDQSLVYTATLTTTPFTVTSAAPVTLASDGRCWLGHPGRPGLNMRPLVAELQLTQRTARSQVLAVFGRAKPIGQSLRRNSQEGSLMVRTSTAAEFAALEALIDDGSPLLLRAPSTWVAYGHRYIQVGDVVAERLTRVGTDARFLVTLPWIEVERPAGPAEGGAGFRWDDVIAEYATWDDLVAANATWADVINGVP